MSRASSGTSSTSKGENRMATTATKRQAFSAGAFVDAASGETMEVINPATGEAIAEVPACGAEDVDRAVEAALSAFEEWRAATPKAHAELLLRLADVIDENAEELARIESQNVGKP